MLKIIKRVSLRKELNELNEKYSHLILEPSENSDVQTTESSFEEPVKETIFENLVIKNEKIIEKESTETQDKTTYSSQTLTTVKPLTAQNILKIATSETKKEETLRVVKKSLSSTLRFSTVEVENAHEDLISCLDINKGATMLVTGSRDTSIKLWDLKTRKLIYSFGGHTSAITSIRFWPLKFYKQCLENIVATDNNGDNEGSQFSA